MQAKEDAFQSLDEFFAEAGKALFAEDLVDRLF